jgi:hypothetical protein
MMDILRYVGYFASTGTLSGVLLVIVLSSVWLMFYFSVFLLQCYSSVYPSAYASGEKFFIKHVSSFCSCAGVFDVSIGYGELSGYGGLC